MLGIELVVILEHNLKERRGIQPVGTAALARIAVQAVFDLVHLLVPFVGHLGLIGRTP